MKYFLTSYPIDEEKGRFFEKNRFRERLLQSLGNSTDVVFVASDPEDYDDSDYYSSYLCKVLEKEGVEVNSLVVLDNRNKGKASALFRKCNLVV